MVNIFVVILLLELFILVIVIYKVSYMVVLNIGIEIGNLKKISNLFIFIKINRRIEKLFLY